MNNDDIMKKIEQEKDRVYSKQLEKNIFLGEYKERVIAALTKEEVEEKGVYKEIIQALKTKEAKNLKIARDIEFSKIKDYVAEAEKIGINYQLVDGLSYSGNIGLVVSADDALENPVENPIIKVYLRDSGKRVLLIYIMNQWGKKSVNFIKMLYMTSCRNLKVNIEILH